MNKNQLRKFLKLYAITDSRFFKKNELVKAVEIALDAGVTSLQYREKHLPFDEQKEEALRLKNLCKKYNVPFIINDNVELAKTIDADGVHLGPKDMSVSAARKILGNDKIIGASARSLEAARFAEEAGADYLGVGAVFQTSTKDDAKQIPQGMLQKICKSVSIPVVAIGGVAQNNISELSRSGIAGVALVSAIFGTPDIKKSTREIRQILERTPFAF